MNRVVWASGAAGDFDEVFEYLKNEFHVAAGSFVDRIDGAVKGLAAHPRSGRIVRELRKQSITRYREVVLSPWRLFYRYEQETVYIVSLIDGRRDVQGILMQRILHQG